jgi:hypothetical protein
MHEPPEIMTFYVRQLMSPQPEIIPHADYARLVCRMVTNLSRKLALCINYLDVFFGLSTNIPRGVPPIVQKRSQDVCNLLRRKYDLDTCELMIE